MHEYTFIKLPLVIHVIEELTDTTFKFKLTTDNSQIKFNGIFQQLNCRFFGKTRKSFDGFIKDMCVEKDLNRKCHVRLFNKKSLLNI